MVALKAVTGVDSLHQAQQVAVGILQESSLDSIVAFAGGGQTNATPLTNEINRITTVATVGDSVMLPKSQPGLSIIVINHGGNQCQVYGNGSDKINDVAAATGVPQMNGSTTLYMCAAAGNWYSNGTAEGYSGGFMTQSYSDGLTASTTHSQANTQVISSMINRFTTVANANDACVLPAAAPGMEITIINAAASNAMQVYANGSDTIDGTAGATGYSQAAGKTVTYFSTAAGAWHKIVSA